MAPESSGAEGGPRISMTDAAVAKLSEVVSSQPQQVAGMRLQIVGRLNGSFQHVLSLVERGREPANDFRVQVEDMVVYIEAQNAAYLDGVKINYEYKGPNISGLEFDNPNPLWLDEVAMLIQQLFDERINPSIAAHGGYVDLLGVEGSTAFVRLGGGCQGCGMADVTLKQGIEVAIKETVPEIEQVVDQTDHASGANPYYQPAKK